MRKMTAYSDHIVAIQRRLIDVEDEEKELNYLPDHRLVVELTARSLYPGAQELQQVSKEVDVPPVLVELLDKLPSQDDGQLGGSVPQIHVQLVIVVLGEKRNADESSELELTKVVVDQELLSLTGQLCRGSRLRHLSTSTTDGGLGLRAL
jgi:hypothetical protein